MPQAWAGGHPSSGTPGRRAACQRAASSGWRRWAFCLTLCRTLGWRAFASWLPSTRPTATAACRAAAPQPGSTPACTPGYTASCSCGGGAPWRTTVGGSWRAWAWSGAGTRHPGMRASRSCSSSARCMPGAAHRAGKRVLRGLSLPQEGASADGTCGLLQAALAGGWSNLRPALPGRPWACCRRCCLTCCGHSQCPAQQRAAQPFTPCWRPLPTAGVWPCNGPSHVAGQPRLGAVGAGPAAPVAWQPGRTADAGAGEPPAELRVGGPDCARPPCSTGAHWTGLDCPAAAGSC